MIRGYASWYAQWYWKGPAMQPSSGNWIWLPSGRNGDIATFSVTTDKVSDICLSWKTACLIMWWPSSIPIWRPYDDNFQIVNIFLGVKSLYFPSKQSAIISEIQSNVKHLAAILKSNMAPSWRKFWHCQNVPRHWKHRYRHLNCGPRCNRTGDMGKTMVILAPYWKSIWRPFWGSIFFNHQYVPYNTCAKFHAFLKNARSWCLAAPLLISSSRGTLVNNREPKTRVGEVQRNFFRRDL